MASRFIQYFEDSFTENWEQIAMVNYRSKQIYFYKDVVREVAKLHILFQELNIQQNDKIALVGNNTPEWAITFLATITYGAVIVPILQDFHPDDIAHIIEHSESKLLFIEDVYWNRLEEKNTSSLRAVFSLSDLRCMRQAQGEKLHLIMRQLPTLFKGRYPKGIQREEVQYAEKDDQEMCVLNYTSGTTGNSKGVMLTGDNFCCVLEFAEELNYGAKGHKVLALLPLAHLYGCVYDFYLPMKVGGCIYFLGEAPSPQLILKAMQDIQPDWFSTVPLVIETIYKTYIKNGKEKQSLKLLSVPILSKIVSKRYNKSLSKCFGGNLRKLFVAGASLDKEVERFLKRIKFPFVVAYGMTECSPLISGNYREVILYSVGKPISGVSVKVNSSSPTKIAGEIWVKGRNVMKGYFHNEEANRRVFTEDRWLKTGDLGVIDRNGNLFIKGRCKSMILTSSGQNVYPEEIEAKLNNSPYIAESLVVQRGEKIVALVVPNVDMFGQGESHESIIANQVKRVNQQIPLYANIHSFEVVPSFEKTPKKSIKRYLYN